MRYLNTIKVRYADKSLENILTLKRSPRSILGYIFTVLLSFLVVFILVQVFNEVRLYWLATGAIGIALEALRKYHDDIYIFNRDRLTHKGGRLSLNYKVPAIQYGDIRAVETTQSVFGRIFDYGDLTIGTASHEGEEIRIEGIRSPEQLSIALDELRLLSSNGKSVLFSTD